MNIIVFQGRIIHFKNGKVIVTRIIHSQLQYIYPASLWHPEKNCLLTGIWLVLTAWKNFHVSKWHPGALKKRLHIFVACIWLWHLHKTIQLLPCGMHPLINLPFFLVVIVGCLRKKKFFQTGRPNVAYNSETFLDM